MVPEDVGVLVAAAAAATAPKSRKKRRRRKNKRRRSRDQEVCTSPTDQASRAAPPVGAATIDANRNGSATDVAVPTTTDDATTETAPSSSSRRKRVEFVYPKEQGAKAFRFRTTTEEEEKEKPPTTTTIAPTASPPSTHEHDDEPTKESIDDIFSSKKKKKTKQRSKNINDSSSSAGPSDATASDETAPKRSPSSVDERTHDSSSPTSRPRAVSFDESVVVDALPSALVPRTVREAVRDARGARPRANSTDGELALPRRGLCDERAVSASLDHEDDDDDAADGRPPPGLVNLGNTCFLNATLQCLAHAPTFRRCVERTADAPSSSGRGGHVGTELLARLRALLRDYRGAGRARLSPAGVAALLPRLGARGRFRPGRQEDAHELLVHLLDALQAGELRAAGIDPSASGWRSRLPLPRLDETTLTHRLFGGYLRSQVSCVDCGHASNSYDPFTSLSLETTSSLDESLGRFTVCETLDEANKWRCGGCGRRVRAKKQLSVFRPSLSLVVRDRKSVV